MALWTPADITTQLWLDVSDSATVTTVSGAVSQINDKSGNGYHVTQSTAGARPLLRAAQLNGLDVMEFISSDALTRTTDTNLFRNINQGLIFCICKTKANSGTGNVINIARNDGTATRMRIGYTSAERATVGGRRQDGDGFVGINGLDDLLDDWILLTGVIDYANGDIFLFENDVLVASNLAFQTAGPTSNTVSANLFIGHLNSTEYFIGEVAQIVVAHGDITTATRNKLNGWAAHKYGLEANLPADHPYKTLAPGEPIPVTLTATSLASATLTTAMIFAVLMSATISIAASIKRDISKILTAAVGVAASDIKTIIKFLSANISLTPSMLKQRIVELTQATIASPALFAFRQFNALMTAGIAVAGSIRRDVSKQLSSMISASPSLSRLFGKSLTGAASASPALIRTPLKSMTASITASPVLGWLVRKLQTLTTAVFISPISLLTISKTLTAYGSATASFKRRIYKRLTVDISIAATFITDITRIVREYLWARQESLRLWATDSSDRLMAITQSAAADLSTRKESVTLWARSKSERLIAVSKDAALMARDVSERLWK
jgi:hypothetical protein